MSAKLILQPEREKSLLRRHPWVFSRAIDQVKGNPELGETVDIFSSSGEWLAKAAFSPKSQIRARVWSWDKSESIDEHFFKRKIKRALHVRKDIIAEKGLSGFRVVAAESDGLPGITIDKYDNVLVCQLLSAGAEFHKQNIINALVSVFPNHSIYERSDVAMREKEGLQQTVGWLANPLSEKQMQELPIIINENGVELYVDIINGHKTGFYLDQRDNREIVGRYSKGKTVLNCFSYTGTFAVYAVKNAAEKVVNVDVSDAALVAAKQNLTLNGLDETKVEFINEDVFQLLRDYKAQGKKFNTIILDPPKFADNRQQITSACRGYKDINRLAMELIEPGGHLLTFSCSGLIDEALFQKVVADAALDANKDVYFIEKLQQASDHPIASFYPEGFYLKGLVCRVY